MKYFVGIITFIFLGICLGFFPLYTLLGVIGIGVCVFIFQNPVRGIYLTALSLPFERVGALELGTMTVRVSQLLIIITLIIFLAQKLYKKELQVPYHPLIIPILVFLGINLLSIINAVNIQRSVTIFIYTVFTVSVAIIIPFVIQTKKELYRTVLFLLVGFLLVGLFGVYQFIGDMAGLPPELTGLRELYTKDILGFTRVQSTALEPLYFANYLLIPLGILFSFLFSQSKKIPLWIVLSTISLGILNLILTSSRGGYIAFVGVLIFLGIWYLRKLFTTKNIVIFSTISLVVMAISLLLFNTDGVIDDFFEHTSNLFGGASYEERVETMTIAGEALEEHLFLGIGIGGFGPASSVHPFVEPKDGWKIVNNEILEVLAETGILGLLSLGIIVLTIFTTSFSRFRSISDKQTRVILVGLLAAFFGILIQYQTFSTLYIMHIWFLIGLIASSWSISVSKKS